MDIATRLLEAVKKEDVLFDVPMKGCTTFRVGGPAKYFVTPDGEAELAAVLSVCREENLPYLVLGRGSNLLVSDEGYDGVVISMRRHFDKISVDKENGIIEAEAGVSMPAAANAALEAGLGGLEFASGIPGTMGGGVLMNAGAYGGDMSQVLIDVRVLEEDGTVKTVTAKEADLSYRHSAFLNTNRVILSCRMQLKEKNRVEIKAQMDDFNGRRRDKQPLEYGSAGSTFKRPIGYFAGKLIEDAGLKGFQIGGAQVSEKHAGFVINRDGATASEVYAVCRAVQKKIWETNGIMLEMEVQLAGHFEDTVE